MLNKRIEWQMNNPTRGLKYVTLDKESTQLLVFTDSFFANNIDTSSQIGFIIVLVDKNKKANLIHWSSIKCKRITRSVLAAELYGIVHGFDIGVAIKLTLDMILSTTVPLILCTDSKSLYECLVKLGTTQEKRLTVDLMSLRKSYERRLITEIRWIKGSTNPADAMTKSSPCKALQNIIDTNTVEIETNE